MEIGLSLGSNLGDRLDNLRQAASKVDLLSGTRIVTRSKVYETEPVGVPLQFSDKPFLNAVLIVTYLDASALAAQLHVIEMLMGRTRSGVQNEPRLIDIDVIYADGMTIQTDEMTIPHPRWSERRFVVQPLADMRPNLMIPGQNRTVQEVLLSLPERPKVVPFNEQW
jgi:2-amino-4-hydroxy-6-hydroxymethyldihydropteridine diphosphokinase